MARTFRCAPTMNPFDAHDWSVEESTAPPRIIYALCPFHEDPQSYHEGPAQTPHMMLVETLERIGGQA